MFGKHFQSMYSGSMVGAGACVFAVWGYVIAHARRGYVELNPKILAAIIGSPEPEIRGAIEFLESPDRDSRSKEQDGRRLVRSGQYLYYVPTHEKYRAIKDQIDHREYMRDYMRARRANVNPVKDVKPVRDRLTQSEAEAETDGVKGWGSKGKGQESVNKSGPLLLDGRELLGSDINAKVFSLGGGPFWIVSFNRYTTLVKVRMREGRGLKEFKASELFWNPCPKVG